MKRNYRSAKFAEYVSTFCMLNGIWLHPTLLIEKRDASRGVGCFVRDACDAGTVLAAVPQAMWMTSPQMSRRGVRVDSCAFQNSVQSHIASTVSASPCPLLEGLFGGMSLVEWLPFVWHLSLELSARHSVWWGWLSSVPTLTAMLEQEQSAKSKSCVTRPDWAAHRQLLRNRLHEEEEEGYRLVQLCAAVVPPRPVFQWALMLALSRSFVVPDWEPLGNDADSDDGRPLLAMMPILDLCNTTRKVQDGSDNGVIEFSSRMDEVLLPHCDQKERSAINGVAAMLTTTRPMSPGDEVLVPYWVGDTKSASPFLAQYQFDESCTAELYRSLRYQLPLPRA